MNDLSTHIKIINKSRFEFELTNNNVTFGEWEIQPPGSIHPESTYKDFVLEDDKGSPSGSEGELSYALGNTTLDMTFCDSYSENGNYVTFKTRRPTALSNRYKLTTSFEVQIDDGKWHQNSCPKSGHPVSVIYTIDAEYPRPATNEEFQVIKHVLPGARQDVFLYIGDPSFNYNCMAWSMGITYAWVNPPTTDPRDMVKLYAKAGEIVHKDLNPHTQKIVYWKSNCNYVLTTKLDENADIDLMCSREGGKLVPSHATRKYEDAYFKSPVWTSKFGDLLLGRHQRTAGNGGMYGHITHSFVKEYGPLPPPPSVENDSNNSDGNKTLESASVIYKDFNEVYQARHLAIMNTPVDVGHMKKLDDIIQNCDTAFRTCFEERYACWKRECANTWSINTYDYVFLHSFRNLALMGPGILPLVVKKMSLEQNFHDLPLYESLQPDNLLCVSQPLTNAEDSLPLEAEQSRARRTVHLYLKYLP